MMNQVTQWDIDVVKKELGYEQKLDWDNEQDNKIIKFFRNKQKVLDSDFVPEPTPLKKSTHSAKCKLSEQIILPNMAKYLSRYLFNNLFNEKCLIKGLIYQDKYIGYFEKKNKKTYFGHITLLATFMGFCVEISLMGIDIIINTELPEKELTFIKKYLEKKLLITITDISKIKKIKIINKIKTEYFVTKLRYSSNEQNNKNDKRTLMVLTERIYENIFLKKNLNCVIQGLIFDNMRVGSFKQTSSKQFDNQCSVLVYHPVNDRVINIKFFTKKSISLTGCKEETDGSDSIKTLLNILQDCSVIYDDILFEENNNWNSIKILEYGITMINSDYNIGFRLNRIVAYNIIKDDYKLRAEFNTESYAGLKVSYFFNDENENNLSKTRGLCYCDKKCKGGGKNLECKKITAIIFQKGNILITGANKDKQLREVYSHINKILYKNYKKIVSFSINDKVF
jgi:TATA-box binding protein (TBP) (component of TFIID and TFIIIB)